MVPPTSGVPYGSPQQVAVPWDATSLARSSLVKIRAKARAALAGKTPLEATTRAHLQEISSQITAALDAQVVREVLD